MNLTTLKIRVYLKKSFGTSSVIYIFSKSTACMEKDALSHLQYLPAHYGSYSSIV